MLEHDLHARRPRAKVRLAALVGPHDVDLGPTQAELEHCSVLLIFSRRPSLYQAALDPSLARARDAANCHHDWDQGHDGIKKVEVRRIKVSIVL